MNLPRDRPVQWRLDLFIIHRRRHKIRLSSAKSFSLPTHLHVSPKIPQRPILIIILWPFRPIHLDLSHHFQPSSRRFHRIPPHSVQMPLSNLFTLSSVIIVQKPNGPDNGKENRPIPRRQPRFPGQHRSWYTSVLQCGPKASQRLGHCTSASARIEIHASKLSPCPRHVTR